MLATATRTDTYPAGGLLTSGTIKRLLQRRRLPSYEAIIHAVFEVVGFRIHVARLWREIFEQAPPEGNPFDAFCAFVWKVDKELFPVNLLYMDDLAYGVETWQDMVFYPIPYIGYGVPWEVEDFHYLEPYERPMVAILDVAGVIGDAGTVDLDAEYYWEELGYIEIPLPTWLQDGERAVELLKQLEPPLDGLATLYHAVCKDSDNLFIDIPSPGWTYEYYEEEGAWEVGEVKWFAEMYAAGKADVEALERYQKWFANEPNAARTVMDVLISLEKDKPASIHRVAGRPLVEVLAQMEEDDGQETD